jgi:hypothetical protein
MAKTKFTFTTVKGQWPFFDGWGNETPVCKRLKELGYSDDIPEEDKVIHDQDFTFSATLEYVGHFRPSASGFQFELRDVETGNLWPMLPMAFNEAAKVMRNGKMTGKWGIEKKGQGMGIRLIAED